jgi:ankyrin repeat protein
MPRKRVAKPVTTLVPHRSPQLAQLLEAAKTCEIESVRRFLAAGGLPDTVLELKYVNGASAMCPLLFKAVSTHYMSQDPSPALHHASLELLLQSGANANAICKDASGREFTPLTAACNIKCCTAPVRLLLAHGANPALQTSTGEVALHSAAMVGRADVCQMLLEAEGCELDVCDCHGLTPLARAVQHGHLQVVELLHNQWGADLFSKLQKGATHNGATLLHVAAESGPRPLLEYLLLNGLDVDAATHAAVTPVCVAALMGNTVAVQTLLDHGASTTAVDGHGDNLLRVAIRGGHNGVVQQLLSRRSKGQPVIGVKATTADGGTALHTAALTDCTDAAALLLHHGAAVNVSDSKGFTPLLIAAARSSAELVQLLLDADAETAALHHTGANVLHTATENIKHPEVLQLLLEQASSAAMMDNVATQCECCGPRTAIMMCEQPAHLKLLRAASADVHNTTDRGNTALHVAAVHKFAAPVLCLLIKAGVDLHALNSAGMTAAKVAADSGNTLAAALLTRAARDT